MAQTAAQESRPAARTLDPAPAGRLVAALGGSHGGHGQDDRGDQLENAFLVSRGRSLGERLDGRVGADRARLVRHPAIPKCGWVSWRSDLLLEVEKRLLAHLEETLPVVG